MFPFLSVINGITKLGSELIEDKDKKNEFAFKTQELAFKAMEIMLSTKTVPWVDALVKIMYAAQTFWRPMATLAMTMFGAYCHVKGIELGDSQYIFDGAFPAWGVSRHVEKQAKLKQKDVWDDPDS